MQQVKDLLSLSYIVLNGVYNVFVVSNYEHFSFLEKQIRALEKEYGAFLDASYQKRLKLYMKIAALLIDAAQTLRNQRFSREQKQLTVLFFGLTALFDDLLDEHDYTQAEILGVIQKIPQRNILLEHICIGLFERITALKTDFQWIDTWQKVIHSQIESQRQVKASHLEPSFLKQLTFDKGGFALVLCLETVFGDQISKAELDGAYQAGGVAQLANDIFDIYKDAQAHITTLVTSETDMNQLRQFYDESVLKTMQLFGKLPFDKNNIRQVMLQYLLVVTRAFVAMDQLQALQTPTNPIFELSNYQRKQLICDMERLRNIKKSLQYTLTWIHFLPKK